MKQPDYTRIGRKYGRWTVEEYAGRGHWKCRCDCGEVRVILTSSLTSGNSSSCGCFKKDFHTTHGLSYTPERNVHMMMLQRCYNPKHDAYPDYGGRGIAVCTRWLGKDGLANFYADMGPRPDGHKIDRIDNDGPYSPENCRWATEAQQQRNTSRNVNITWDGRTMCAKDWAKEKGMSYQTFLYRVEVWGVELAMTEPVRRKKPAGFIDHQALKKT